MSGVIFDGGLAYAASLATLATVLTPNVLRADFGPQNRVFGEISAAGKRAYFKGDSEPVYTLAMWADMLSSSPPSSTSQIDPTSIRAVLALGLQGGGMSASAAVDTAERLHRGQLNRKYDFLAAALVRAVVLVGT
jgi:hypothetical protein